MHYTSCNNICRFNKTLEDFKNLKEYNDYLEEVEDISMCEKISFYLQVYNLVNDLDKEETNKRIATYREQNKQQIAQAQARRAQQDFEKKQQLLLAEKEREKLEAASNKTATNDAPTTTTITSAAVEQTTYRPGMQQAQAQQQQPKAKAKTTTNKNAPVTEEDLKKRARAGGYNPHESLQRAKEEAHNAIFLLWHFCTI